MIYTANCPIGLSCSECPFEKTCLICIETTDSFLGKAFEKAVREDSFQDLLKYPYDIAFQLNSDLRKVKMFIEFTIKYRERVFEIHDPGSTFEVITI